MQEKVPSPAACVHNGRVTTAEPAVEQELANALDEVIRERSVVPLYQPIFDISEAGKMTPEERENAEFPVVAYEALARGPKGSPVEFPDKLFGTARATGRLAELDWVCRVTAVQGAMDSGLKPPYTLFCNMEPEAIDSPPPFDLRDTWERAKSEVRVMTEITERAMTSRPAELLSTAGGIRDAGWGIALDDVGAEPASLALMPFLDPDVIKLDLRLIQDTPTEDLAEVINAVNAEAERSNLTILSEGIETLEHERTSLAFGATLGQGWLYGKPAPLPAELPEPTRQVQLLGRKLGARQARVSRIVGTMQSIRSGNKPILHSMSRHLESEARRLGETAVLLAIFEDAHFFQGATRARYEELARESAFVGVIGPGMTHEPTPGVRGANIDANDELFDQWGIAVIAPHFAAAFVARPKHGSDRTAPDVERNYDFALTYNREFVVETARNMMSKITPHTAAPAMGAAGI
jgi:EAL domain-containing protein (putative c-di-GMP-specific phosphodiesterase class I)